MLGSIIKFVMVMVFVGVHDESTIMVYVIFRDNI